jgi:hypothetical protein
MDIDNNSNNKTIEEVYQKYFNKLSIEDYNE